MPTRVMLVEDHTDLRHLVTVLLAREPDLEMVAQASSLVEARQHSTSAEFEVVISDLGTPTVTVPT
jgi:two-component system, NarL family, response regulator NreC